MGSPNEEKEDEGLNGSGVKGEAESLVLTSQLTGGTWTESSEETGSDEQTVDSWKRAWEVTSMLKAKIEMIKVRGPDSTVGVT